MEIRVGNDIIEVNRIKKLINKYDEKFLNKVYTEKEIEYCNKKNESKYLSYAARFAAKEAVYKAISDVFGKSIEWKKIEILKQDNGRPIVNLFDLNNKINCIDISISHVREFAIATVIVSYNGTEKVEN